MHRGALFHSNGSIGREVQQLSRKTDASVGGVQAGALVLRQFQVDGGQGLVQLGH
jgi:hypothetical protein